MVQLLCLGDHLLSLYSTGVLHVWRIGAYDAPEVSGPDVHEVLAGSFSSLSSSCATLQHVLLTSVLCVLLCRVRCSCQKASSPHAWHTLTHT